MDFGEKVMYMPIGHGCKLNKLKTKWSFGRFCGIRPRSNEKLIMTTEGIEKAKNVRRLPEPDRWTQDGWEDLRGLPWAYKPVRQRVPGTIPIPISDAPLPPQQEAPRAAAKPRRVYITRKVVEDYGYTPGCRGCEAVLAEDPTAVSRNHTEKYRKRMAEAMAKDELGKRRLDDAASRMASKSARVEEAGDEADKR